MPITFHILDSFARDEKIVSQTETEKLVSYTADEDDSDEEFHMARAQDKSANGGKDHTNKSFVIHLFGKTAEGASMRCDIKGFKPFFFIRAPDGSPSVHERARLAVIQYLKRHIPNANVANTIEVEKCKRKELFGFTQDREVNMLRITVPSKGLFMDVKNCFCNSNWIPELKRFRGQQDALGLPFEAGAPMVYEANLDPMLRFLHLRNLKPCNWATVEGFDLDDTEDGMFEADWEDIGPCNAPPAPVAPFKIASWDIECMSTTGAFPMATKGDPIIQIGTILGILGKPETEKHIFVLGTCDKIEGAVVHTFKKERELLLNWLNWIDDQGVDILMGYNIFGFDEKYLWERCEFLQIHQMLEVQQLNRLHQEGQQMRLDEKRLSSSAMGDNFMWLWNTTGRLRIDLYHYIKRGYQLPSYKLDDTSRNFLGETVKSIEQKVDCWVLKLKNNPVLQDVAKGRSLVLLNANGDTLCEKVSVVELKDLEIWIEVPEDVERDEVSKYAIVKDDLSPKEMFKMHEQGPAERAVIAKYCVQDCQLVLDLFRKLDVFNNSMSMANVCSVPVSYIFLRGQGVKIESLMFKYCYERGQCIGILPSNQNNNETYEGAIVLDPTPGFYTTPVGVADFASLYPSTIISENISHDTLVWVKDFDEQGRLIQLVWGSNEYDNLEGQRYTDIEYDNMIDDPEDQRKFKRKIKAGVRVCRYAQDKIGTIPQIVAGLLAARKAKRKEGEKESDPFRKALLDSEQLAYKLTANSLYGQLGSGTFKVRLRPLAASVTAYGRKQILFAKRAIEERYGRTANNPHCCATADTVYGDSVAHDTILEQLRYNGSLLKPTAVSELETILPGVWKKCIDSVREEKESFETPGLETLTEKGWTAVHRIIRHTLAHHKKMLTVTYTNGSETGSICVSDDHSMLLANCTEISPANLKKGDRLLTHTTVPNTVLSVAETPYSGFVYDLTTDNHHFQAGPLGLVVHNTDSLFIAFNPRDPATGVPLQGREAVKKTIELTEEAGKYVTKALKAPHDFEFDKVYWPFIIFSKKRYVGHKYEDPDDPDHYKLAFMGVALKRRDYAAVVKRIYSGALNILLHERNVPKAAEFVQTMSKQLVEGKFGLQPLIISKSLRAEYADPSRIAHKALADRMAKRDPGNAPASGDRIPFIYIQPQTGQQAPDLQGERIETPVYIKEKGLKPDYMFYIDHQIANPVCQLFGVVVDQIPGFDQHPSPRGGWSNDQEKRIVQKETIAYNLLFGEAIQVNNTGAKRAFGKLLGVESSDASKTVSRPARAVPASVAPVKKQQSILDSMFLDTLKVAAVKEVQKKKAVEAEAEAKATTQEKPSDPSKPKRKLKAKSSS